MKEIRFLVIILIFFRFYSCAKENATSRATTTALNRFNASVTTTASIKSSHRPFLTQKLNLTLTNTAPSHEKPEERKGLQQRDNNTLYLPPLFNDTLNLNLSLSHNTSTLRSFMRVLNLDQNALLNQSHSLYEDKKQKSAVLVVWERQDDLEDRTLFGLVTHKNSTYKLLPGSYANASEAWNLVLFSKMYHLNLMHNHTGHNESAKKVIEEVLSWDNTNDYLVVNGGMSKRTLFFREEQRNLMEIEIFIVVDQSLYLKWLEVSNFNETATEYNIRYYISHFVDEIDKKFSSIKYSNYKYQAKLVGYYITKDTRDCPYTESDHVDSSRPLDARISLEGFSAWLKENKSRFPGHDIALVLTDHELQSHQGLAYIRTACTDKGTAIISERGPKETVSTAVHEIGHLLGAFHDGWNNDCDSDDNHIMTSQHNAKQYVTFDSFSSCSTSFFQQFINVLEKYDTNCFRRSSAPNIIDRRILATPAGQKFDLETQCKLVYGVKSHYCSNGLVSDESVCEKIFCYNPATSSCSRTPALQALDGTTCGNKKWCSNQQCSFHLLAPSVAETGCVQGDFTWFLQSDQGKLTCGQLGSAPYHCYDKKIRQLCCQTCSNLADSTRTSCEYGDKMGNCETLERKEKAEIYCGMKHIGRACCQTCDRILKRVK